MEMTFQISPPLPKEIQYNYNVAIHEAPVALGIIAHDAPAHAWVRSVRLNGNHITLKLQQVSSQLKSLMRGASVGKASAYFYKPNQANNPVPGQHYLQSICIQNASSGVDTPHLVSSFSDFGLDAIATANTHPETTSDFNEQLKRSKAWQTRCKKAGLSVRLLDALRYIQADTYTQAVELAKVLMYEARRRGVTIAATDALKAAKKELQN